MNRLSPRFTMKAGSSLRRLTDQKENNAVAPPILTSGQGGRSEDILRILGSLHDILGRWFTQHPAQWLWVHHRWPSSGPDPEE